MRIPSPKLGTTQREETCLTDGMVRSNQLCASKLLTLRPQEINPADSLAARAWVDRAISTGHFSYLRPTYICLRCR